MCIRCYIIACGNRCQTKWFTVLCAKRSSLRFTNNFQSLAHPRSFFDSFLQDPTLFTHYISVCLFLKISVTWDEHLNRSKSVGHFFPPIESQHLHPPWGKETLGAARAKERGTREDKNWLAISTGKRTESVGNKPMLVSLFSLSLTRCVCVCRVAIDCGGPAGNQPTNQPLTGQHRGRRWNRKSWRGDDERKGTEEGRRKERSKRKRRKIESKKKKKKTKKKWTSSDVKSSGKSIFSSKNKFGACIISSSPLLRSLSWPFIWLENPSKIKRSGRATL